MKIEAVLFDLDGTIIDSEPLYEQSDKAFLSSQGIEIPDEVWPSFIGMGSRAFIQLMQSKYGLKLDLEEGMRLKDEAYKNLARNNLAVFEPVVAFARITKDSGKKSAIASGSTLDTILFCVESLKIKSLFDDFVSANQVKSGKPDPDIFLFAADRLGVNPANCLVLEDSVYGVIAAKRAGMRVVAFPYAESMRDDKRYDEADWLLAGNASSFDAQSFVRDLVSKGQW